MLMLYVAIVIYNKKLSDVLSRYSAKRLLEKHGEKKQTLKHSAARKHTGKLPAKFQIQSESLISMR